MGRDLEYPLGPIEEANLAKLLDKVNVIRARYGKPMYVSSGYRPGTYNKAAGGAPNSSHKTCEAVDFRDKDRELTKWLLQNSKILEELDLYMEHPLHTPSWVHLQTRPTKSGSRIFKP